MTYHVIDDENREEITKQVVAELRAGEIWGLNADSAYSLVADAFHFKGVRALQELKGSRNLITPILIGRPTTLEGLVAEVTPSMKTLIDEFWPGPLTIVARPNPSLAWAASTDAISVRLPACEDTRELAWALGPMVAIAASRDQHPAPLTVSAAAGIWWGKVENWVDSGTADPAQVSTVVDFRGLMPNVIRLGAVSAKELRVHVPSVTMLST